MWSLGVRESRSKEQDPSMRQNSNHASLVTTQLITLALFALTVAGSARAGEKTVLPFNGADGESPMSNLVADSAGNLYGVTNTGGIDCSPNAACGLVFRLSKTSGVWKETILHKFTGGNDGSGPNSLILDAEGNLYGTTLNGGGRGGQCGFSTGCGIVFRLTPVATGTWPEKVLYRFSGGDGASPNALAFDSHGNLYGTAGGGGGGGTNHNCSATGCGVLFELTPTASVPWKLTPLHTFIDASPDGQDPLGLAFGAGDVLYVTTYSGGVYSSSGGLPGAIFQFTPGAGGWTSSLIHSFAGTGDGVFPNAAAILDAAGNLYGSTTFGGPLDYGLVYKLTPGAGGAWTETILYTFQAGIDGRQPNSQLGFDAAGNLYGATLYGGGTANKCEFGCGTIFKLTALSSAPWPESLAIRFVNSNGSRPASAVVLNIDGNLYGTTASGGANNDGLVFELTP
jgi:uncharacterized repeat protein (TIGR03803 family)